MLPNITEKEKAFLLKIESFLYQYTCISIEEDGKDAFIDNPTWTPTSDQISVGVLSSLVKKGLVQTDYNPDAKIKRPSNDSLCWLTALGVEALISIK